jgi:hypothetical protein
LSPENKSYVRNCVAVEPCFVITYLQGGQLGCYAVLIFHCVVSMHHGKDYSVEQLEKLQESFYINSVMHGMSKFCFDMVSRISFIFNVKGNGTLFLS